MFMAPMGGRGRRQVGVMMVPMRAPLIVAPAVVVPAMGEGADAESGYGKKYGNPEFAFHRFAPRMERMFRSE
jgi:hypothetical protein